MNTFRPKMKALQTQRMKTMSKLTIKGYKQFKRVIELLEESVTLVILFVGDIDNDGISWCFLCNEAMKVTETLLDLLSGDCVYMIVQIGDPQSYFNMNNPFRRDPGLMLHHIPRLMLWKTDNILSGNDCCNRNRVQKLLESNYNTEQIKRIKIWREIFGSQSERTSQTMYADDMYKDKAKTDFNVNVLRSRLQELEAMRYAKEHQIGIMQEEVPEYAELGEIADAQRRRICLDVTKERRIVDGGTLNLAQIDSDELDEEIEQIRDLLEQDEEYNKKKESKSIDLERGDIDRETKKKGLVEQYRANILRTARANVDEKKRLSIESEDEKHDPVTVLKSEQTQKSRRLYRLESPPDVYDTDSDLERKSSLESETKLAQVDVRPYIEQQEDVDVPWETESATNLMIFDRAPRLGTRPRVSSIRSISDTLLKSLAFKGSLSAESIISDIHLSVDIARPKFSESNKEEIIGEIDMRMSTASMFSRTIKVESVDVKEERPEELGMPESKVKKMAKQLDREETLSIETRQTEVGLFRGMKLSTKIITRKSPRKPDQVRIERELRPDRKTRPIRKLRVGTPKAVLKEQTLSKPKSKGKKKAEGGLKSKHIVIPPNPDEHEVTQDDGKKDPGASAEHLEQREIDPKPDDSTKSDRDTSIESLSPVLRAMSTYEDDQVTDDAIDDDEILVKSIEPSRASIAFGASDENVRNLPQAHILKDPVRALTVEEKAKAMKRVAASRKALTDQGVKELNPFEMHIYSSHTIIKKDPVQFNQIPRVCLTNLQNLINTSEGRRGQVVSNVGLTQENDIFTICFELGSHIHRQIGSEIERNTFIEALRTHHKRKHPCIRSELEKLPASLKEMFVKSVDGKLKISTLILLEMTRRKTERRQSLTLQIRETESDYDSDAALRKQRELQKKIEEQFLLTNQYKPTLDIKMRKNVTKSGYRRMQTGTEDRDD